LFPKTRKPDEPWNRWYPTELLCEAEKLAKLEHLEHGAWHPFSTQMGDGAEAFADPGCCAGGRVVTE